MNRAQTGIYGENAAARYLVNGGYRILVRNYRSRFGEIDIISQKDGFIVFTEVKTRTENSLLLPREAVDRKKRERIVKTAMCYLAKTSSRLQPRFDVMEITIAKGSTRILHIQTIENAFP